MTDTEEEPQEKKEYKKKDILIHYSKTKNLYYLQDDVVCYNCSNEIKDMALFENDCTFQKQVFRFYCLGCMRDKENSRNLWNEYLKVVITKKLPRDALPILSWTPDLKTVREWSAFAINEIDTEQTIDKTRYAKQPSIKNARIGDESAINDGKDANMQLEHGIKYLSHIKSWKPIEPSGKTRIGYERGEVKQIEENKIRRITNEQGKNRN